MFINKMAPKREEIFTCSICLQLLEDPVTIGCGHSYCKKCINIYWDRKFTERAAYSCPQCRQTFTPRPTLNRNALLAELLEEHKKASEASAFDDNGSDGVRDVLCDVCIGKKRNALKFCLTCLVSYCQIHLKSHFEVPPFKKHKLVQASTCNKKVICERHNKRLEIHCRTDHQFLCALCVVNGHQGHDTVAVTEEMEAMQKQLQRTKQEVMGRVVDKEKKMTELNEVANSIQDTAWEVCDEFQRLCMESVCLYASAMDKKIADVREKVGNEEKTGLNWINTQLGQLRFEVCQLKKRNIQLTQLFQTEEPIEFLQGYQAFGSLPAFDDGHTRVKKLTELVRNQKDKMKNLSDREKCGLYNKKEEMSLKKRPVWPSLRQYFVTKYKNHTLDIDPNTVAACLSLSSSNKELSWGATDQAHPDHTGRFTYYPQALCKQGLTGDSYWEVEWDGGIVEVAVSYRGIQRKGSGNDCCFGHNNMSWKLICCSSGCRYWHDKLERARIPQVTFNRLGVHLNYEEGILSFYSVNTRDDEFKLLHQSQVIFTEPLYPGFSVDMGSTLKICTM